MLKGLIDGINTLSVIGMCKNAGKTTVLNSLIHCCEDAGEILGLTSVGRDGERSDLVTNTKKPEIFIRGGAVIATAETLLEYCDISREILWTSGIHTPLGEIVIVRARSSGYVQLGGASMTEQTAVIRDELFEFGVDRVIIDGAISRKSLATPDLCEAAVLCTGASYNINMRVTASDTAYIAGLFGLPQFSHIPQLCNRYTVMCEGEISACGEFSDVMPVLKIGECSAMIIKGGVTDNIAKEVLSASRFIKGVAIVAEDASRLLLSESMFDRLVRCGARIYVLRRAGLLAVAVNPFSAYGVHYERDAFKEAVAEELALRNVDIPVLNIMEEV